MTESGQSYGFPLTVATLTNVGRVRTNNEDSYGHLWLEDGSLWVMVADGMGGHEAGEVASGLAVQVVEEVISREPEKDPRERLHDALLEANAAILEEGQRSGTRGMGTTAITVVLKGQEAYVALIGDSRCYHVRKGHLLWRTLDHTRVQMLVDNGEITEEEARTHPEAGMLTRALGHDRMADGRPLEPDVLPEPLWLEPGDALLLCSDGLHDLVEDWEIGEMIAGRTPEDAATGLVNEACDRGGHDNVTVAIITAGQYAAAYDPNYVPEWQQQQQGAAGGGQYPEYEGEDYDTFDNDPTEQGVPQAAAPQYVGAAIAAGPTAPQAPTPVTAATGVVAPGQMRAPKKSNRKLIIGAVVVVVGLGLLLIVAAIVFVVVWTQMH